MNLEIVLPRILVRICFLLVIQARRILKLCFAVKSILRGMDIRIH